MTSAERHEARFQRRRQARDAKKCSRNASFGTLEDVFSLDNLYCAYKESCKGVSWKASIQSYKANALANIYKTQQEIFNGKYRSKGFVEFDIFDRGKVRHIRSVHISERVVQRCLCDFYLIPLLSRTFIYDNSASLKGKGMDFALKRLRSHLQSHFKKHGTKGYVLLFDFSKFFESIDHDVLLMLLSNTLTDSRLISLVWYFVEMFGDRGLGLGSQISQICALLLPNALDHMIKEKLGISGYGRYMDDGYLIHESKEYLKFCLENIREKCSELGIVLNVKKTQIVKLSHGFTFLKIRHTLTDTGRVVRRLNPKSTSRMRRKLKKLNGKVPVVDMLTSYLSWRGHAQRCSSHNTLMNLDEFFDRLTSVD